MKLKVVQGRMFTALPRPLFTYDSIRKYVRMYGWNGKMEEEEKHALLAEEE